MDSNYNKKVLMLAVYAGEIMMKNGAEIYRVEDTIVRMCSACGIKSTEVFSTPTGIFISIDPGDDSQEAQTYIKRMRGLTTDMGKISLVNNFSRRFTSDDTSVEEAMAILRKIDGKRTYHTQIRIMAAALVAMCFCVIFGGGFPDALIACVAGGASYTISAYLSKYEINYFIHGFLCCAAASIIALLLCGVVPNTSYQPIIIGTLMIYVPGVAITNSIRDFLSGDMLSGLARMADAVITAASLAAGAGIVIQIWTMTGGGI
ncbi:MAG: threonine/serine exporter family protein [Eubacterium sp.]|nr:threonine/serine exporter family protein [Candidatus Colimonas fimequi]